MAAVAHAEAHRALFELAKAPAVCDGDAPRAFALIAECGARLLDVERSSVWLVEEAPADELRCVDLYVHSSTHHSRGSRLLRSDFPCYFKALEEHRSVAAAAADVHPATREFASGYLREHGIGAMLDAPIRRGGALAGVVCFEHVGGERAWQDREISIAASLADITNLVLSNEVRRRSDEQLRAITENANDTIYMLDSEGRIDFISQAVERSLGHDPETLIGRHFQEFVHPEDLEACLASTRSAISDPGNQPVVAYRLRHQDGSWRWHETRIAVTGQGQHFSVVGVGRDVTAERQAQMEQDRLAEQLRQSQKMEAVGRLAGGVAHDFNNLLTVINGLSETVLADDALAASHRQLLQMILDAGERAADLTRQLLAFGRKQVLATRVIDLAALLTDLEPLLRRLLPEDIEIVITTPETPVPVHADATQLQQVLVNLAVNGSDAMANGGRLELGLERQGDNALLRVRDNGSGMSETVSRQIFEPFFSTKHDLGGSGLGLAVSFGIVKQHSGHLSVHSAEGAGSCFTMTLPTSSEPLHGADEDAIDSAAFDARDLPLQRILIVEDEATVRGFMADGLRQCGFQVTEATDAQDALQRVSIRPKGWDLLITDLIMPGMNGAQLFEQAHRIVPELEVLFVSGYPQNVLDEKLQVNALHYLPKPFGIDALCARIAQLARAASPQTEEAMQIGG